jgi:cell division protein FtsI/penicillin-binding protein 2
MKGTVGRDGLEKQFDSQLQGEAGGAISGSTRRATR